MRGYHWQFRADDLSAGVGNRVCYRCEVVGVDDDQRPAGTDRFAGGETAGQHLLTFRAKLDRPRTL